jgi:hypothetical protein
MLIISLFNLGILVLYERRSKIAKYSKTNLLCKTPENTDIYIQNVQNVKAAILYIFTPEYKNLIILRTANPNIKG